MSARVRHVLVGQAEELARPGVMSAIAKRKAPQPVSVGELGIVGDEQADRHVHGGRDKAVHLYSWLHYEKWRQELPTCRVLNEAGAFGENLSVLGLDEFGVCIADRWRVGTVILEVSQGRQPCWKLNLRFGLEDMATRVQQSIRAGWYCRVVKPGRLTAGDAMELLDRPYPLWSVSRLLALIRDRECERTTMDEVLALPLTPSWRRLFTRRRELSTVEDWERRLVE